MSDKASKVAQRHFAIHQACRTPPEEVVSRGRLSCHRGPERRSTNSRLQAAMVRAMVKWLTRAAGIAQDTLIEKEKQTFNAPSHSPPTRAVTRTI